MKFILHIGQSKTGTSSIQHFLTVNSKKLLKQGILYPSVKINGLTVEMVAHNAVADSVVGVNRYPFVTAENYFKQFIQEATLNQCHLIILSAEHFFQGEPRVWDFANEDDFYEAYGNKLIKLKSYLIGHEVSVIVYLRPQLEWFASAVAQTVRTAGLISKNNLYQNDAQFYKLMKPILNYPKMLDLWDSLISPESLEVIPYNKDTFLGMSVVADFVERIGINNYKYLYSELDLNINQSLSAEYIEVKKVLNKVKKSKNKERVIISCLEFLSKEHGSGIRYHVDKKIQHEILKLAKQDNSILNARFFNGGLSFLESNHDIDKQLLTSIIKKRAFKLFKMEICKPKYKVLFVKYVFKDLIRRKFLPLHTLLHMMKNFFQRKKSFHIWFLNKE